MEKNLDYYISCFTNLKRASKAGEKSPHKVIVLLALIDYVEQGLAATNMIALSEEFEQTFHNVWHERVGVSAKYHDELHPGFFGMKSEPFWHLQPWSQGNSLKNCVSMESLTSVYEGAIFDEELFTLITIPDSREKLRTTLVSLLPQETTSDNLFDVNDFLSMLDDVPVKKTKDLKYYEDLFTKIANTDRGSKKTICKLVLLHTTMSYLNWRKQYYPISSYIPLLAQWEGPYLKMLQENLSIKQTSTAFSVPFLTLEEETFWKLVPAEGYKPKSENSHSFMTFYNLQESFDGVEVDDELVKLMTDSKSREALEHHLESLLRSAGKGKRNNTSASSKKKILLMS